MKNSQVVHKFRVRRTPRRPSAPASRSEIGRYETVPVMHDFMGVGTDDFHAPVSPSEIGPNKTVSVVYDFMGVGTDHFHDTNRAQFAVAQGCSITDPHVDVHRRPEGVDTTPTSPVVDLELRLGVNTPAEDRTSTTKYYKLPVEHLRENEKKNPAVGMILGVPVQQAGRKHVDLDRDSCWNLRSYRELKAGYTTEEAACKTCDVVALDLRGDKALTNFPRSRYSVAEMQEAMRYLDEKYPDSD